MKSTTQGTANPDAKSADLPEHSATECTKIANCSSKEKAPADVQGRGLDSEMEKSIEAFNAHLSTLTPEERENKLDILQMFWQTPARLRVEGKKESFSVVLVDETPAEYRQLMEILGQTDIQFVDSFLDQIAIAYRTPDGISNNDINLLISFIKNVKPKDAVEVLLATQMMLIHRAMVNSSQLTSNAKALKHFESHARTMTQFARTSVAQAEALRRYRTGGEQKVTVQHVSISDGGRAIVAQVNEAQSRAQGPVPNSVSRKPLPSPRESPMEKLAERDSTPVNRSKARR